MQEIGQRWSCDFILSNEMEKEVCWGFLEKVLPPEMKNTKMRKLFLLLPPSFLLSFLPSQNASRHCEDMMLGVTAATL